MIEYKPIAESNNFIILEENVSGLFFGSSAWAEGRLEVQVPRDCLHPIPISKGRASVDAGANGFEFRGGQRLVDPLGPAR